MLHLKACNSSNTKLGASTSEDQERQIGGSKDDKSSKIDDDDFEI
jgi:hypothetical protein